METQKIAEDVLSRRWGGPVRLTDGEPLGGSDRSHVVRNHVDTGTVDIATVVVKHATTRDGEAFDTTSTSGPAWRLFNDWAGLEFLSECFGDIDDIPVPRFIAGDKDNGLIVMTDVGVGKGLDPLLLNGTADEATACMIKLFRTVGRVHAVTCGKQKRYDQIREGLGPRNPSRLEEHLEWHREHPVKGLASLGIDVGEDFLREIDECITEFRGESPFRVYCHHDPCPDNIIRVDDRIYLLDFEFSSMGNAAIDIRYPRAIWPTCWCAARTPADVVEKVEAAYREELVKGCPAAVDDGAFYRQLASGCADAAMSGLGDGRLNWVLEKSSRLGDFRPAQLRLARLDAFVDIAERHGYFPVVADVARRAAVEMRSRLSSDFREMPFYPAFR